MAILIKMRGLLALLIFTLALAPPGHRAQAATFTWTGGGANDNWSTGANWGGTAPTLTSGTLVFAGGIRLTPITDVNWSIAGMSFNSTAGPFTLGGSQLTIGSGGILNSSTSTQTINNAIVLSAAQTWSATSGNLVFGGNLNNGGSLLTVTSALATSINGVISGTGGLTKRGVGTLTLTGSNSLSGTVTLSAGTLLLGSDTAVGTGTLSLANAKLQATGGARTLANAVTLAGSPTFLGSDNLTLNGAATLTASRTLTVNSTGLVTFAGTIDQSKSGSKIAKAGSGTLVLNGANTFTGGITLSAGTLVLGNNAAAGTGLISLGNGTIQAGGAARTLANAVTLAGNTTFSGANDLTFTGATAVAATRTLTISNSNTTFGGVISGAGGLTKSGAGTLTLSGASANTFSGNVTVNDGTLVFGKTDGLNAMAGVTLTVGDNAGGANSAIVQLAASNQIPNAATVNINADGLLDLQGFTDAIGALNLTSGSITGAGASRLDLGGNLTMTGTGTNVGLITTNLGLNGARNFTVNDNGVSTDNDLTVSGVISTAFNLAKLGTGTLSLSGANTYSGGTNVNAGTLSIDHSAALGTGAVNLGNTSGALDASLLFSTTAGRTVTNNLTVRAGNTGTLTLGGLNTSGTNTFGGTVTLAKSATVTAEAGGVVDFTGVISGATFGLTKIGAGTVRLSGTNTYTGLTTINAGTLAYGASNVIATGGVTIDGATAVLDLTANHTDTVGHGHSRQRRHHHRQRHVRAQQRGHVRCAQRLRLYPARRQRGADENDRRHRHALGREYLHRRHHDRRRHAPAWRGEQPSFGLRGQRGGRRVAGSQRLQSNHRLADQRGHGDGRCGQPDDRRRQYFDDIFRRAQRQRRADESGQRRLHDERREQSEWRDDDQRGHLQTRRSDGHQQCVRGRRSPVARRSISTAFPRPSPRSPAPAASRSAAAG